MATRAFLALDVDEAIRTELIGAQRALAGCGATLRPVEQDNLHVTLQFLGDVADDVMDQVLAAAAKVAGGIQPFDFNISGLLAVPPRGPIRMVWANVTDSTGRMKQLAEGLADALGGLGLHQEERDFRPHLTLARIKTADNPARFRRAVEEFAAKDFGLQHAEELAAYASQLISAGPIYTPLRRWPLGSQFLQ